VFVTQVCLTAEIGVLQGVENCPKMKNLEGLGISSATYPLPFSTALEVVWNFLPKLFFVDLALPSSFAPQQFKQA
jgi:hypothetical protein